METNRGTQVKNLRSKICCVKEETTLTKFTSVAKLPGSCLFEQCLGQLFTWVLTPPHLLRKIYRFKAKHEFLRKGWEGMTYTNLRGALSGFKKGKSGKLTPAHNTKCFIKAENSSIFKVGITGGRSKSGVFRTFPTWWHPPGWTRHLSCQLFQPFIT